MGRGDKKTRKGKIWKGSYGVSRRRKAIKGKLAPVTAKAVVPVPVVVTVEEKPKAKRTPKKKEPAAE